MPTLMIVLDVTSGWLECAKDANSQTRPGRYTRVSIFTVWVENVLTGQAPVSGRGQKEWHIWLSGDPS